MDTGRSSVLVVEDDADMRELMGFVVQGLGLVPKLAADVDEALTVFCDDPKIGLILLDLGVPGMMCAEEFIDTARRMSPSHRIKFILASGHSNVSSKAEQLQADGFLFKPFGRSELRNAILKTLENGPST